MTFEILLVSGCVLGVLSVVAVLTALVDGRRPRVAALVAVMSGGLVVWSTQVSPHALQFSDIPEAFVTVVAAVLN